MGDAQPPRSSAPVFVVGAPRSGTTMLAAKLASHRSFSAGPETQFFSKVPLDDWHIAAADPDWPERAATTIEGITLANQKVFELFEQTPLGLRAFLREREPSIAAALESLTVPFAAKRGKPRWVEKTPNHILNLSTIRELWPAARIIRIVRDPRDVGMSTCRLPTFSNSPLANVYLWLSWQIAAEEFLAGDPLSVTVRYESIVDDAPAELARLCAFLGEEYDPAMEEFGTAARHVSSSAETWKRPVAGGLNASRKFAWRATMPEDVRIVANLLCQEYLERFGYDRKPVTFVTRYGYRLSSEYVEDHESWLVAEAKRGIRWMPTHDPSHADRILEPPEYGRFRDPLLLARLWASRLRDSARATLG